MLKELLAILLLSLSGWESVLAWQPPDTTKAIQGSLASPVSKYSLDTDNALLALIKVASDFKLPMGVEWIRPSAAGARFSHSWRQTTVSAIIQDIVDSQPGYELDPTGSETVLHVRPSAFRNESGDIVNAHIGLFEVKHEKVEWASRRLARLAGTLMVPPEPPSQIGHGEAWSIGTATTDQQVTVRIENGTVRDILDQLCLADEKIWIIMYPAIQTRTPARFLRTASLYSELPIADRWQPVWALLPWGVPRDIK